jgi:heme oxygenase (biliverdin-IX-beta and delta-forming)
MIVTNRNLAHGPVATPAIEHLRQETSTAHARLDTNFRLVDRLSAVDRRGQLLAGYHSLHRETEARIAPLLGEIADLDFSARRRSLLIAESLGILGQSARADSPTSPDKLTQAEAFGALYVLEGSSLGGRVILKELKRRGASLRALASSTRMESIPDDAGGPSSRYCSVKSAPG